MAATFLVRTLTVGAGQVITQDLSIATPATIGPGDYWLIGRVENPTAVYDEDQVVYHVN